MEYVHYGKGTSLLLASGKSVLVEELQVGQELLCADSAPAQVVDIKRSLQPLAYRLTPKIGNVVYVGGDHTLVLVGMCGPIRGRIVHMTALEYAHLPPKVRATYNWFKKPVASFQQSAHGSATPDEQPEDNSVALMRQAAPIELETYAYLYGLLVVAELSTPDKRAFAINTFRHTKLRNNTVVDDNFLDSLFADPDAVRSKILYGASSIRAEFLAGALDASSYNRTTKRFDVLVGTQAACDDLLFAAMSLGYYCSHIVNVRYNFAQRKLVKSYTVYVYPNTNSCMPSRVFDLLPIKVQFSGLFSTDFMIEQVFGKIETYTIAVKRDSDSADTGQCDNLEKNNLTHVFFGDFSIGAVHLASSLACT